jgi:GNAT superfamily N-acetyltransferase
MTGAEIRHLAAQLKPVVNPTLCPLAFVGDEAVGFALALLDFSVPVKHMNGRLLPFGIFKMLWYRRQIRHVRILTLGMKPQFRGRGIDMLLMLHIWRECAKLGINSGECSWILEDNLPMRHVLEHDGGYPYKTYRVFEKPLAPSD